MALSYLMVYGTDPENCFYLEGLDAPNTNEENLLNLAKALKIPESSEPIINMGHIFKLWV